MKEYRLLSWTSLPAAFGRTGYRRMLSDLSLRHMSLRQLVTVSGLRRHEVQQLLDALFARGVLEERDFNEADSPILGTFSPVGDWFRRAFRSAGGPP
jgi:hypothetical protein